MTAVSRSAAAVGEPLDFTQTLKNTICTDSGGRLGEARTYHIFGTTPTRMAGASPVDHERCAPTLPSRTGSTAGLFLDSVPVGNVGLGPAKLYTSVSIVFLEGCSSKYGCHHTSVSQPIRSL